MGNFLGSAGRNNISILGSGLIHVVVESVGSRGETIRVNAVLRIAFECIAIHCHIAIFYWILVKRHFIWEYGF